MRMRGRGRAGSGSDKREQSERSEDWLRIMSEQGPSLRSGPCLSAYYRSTVPCHIKKFIELFIHCFREV